MEINRFAALALCFLISSAGCGEKKTIPEPAIIPAPAAESDQGSPITAGPADATDREALLERYFDQLKDLDVNYKKINSTI